MLRNYVVIDMEMTGLSSFRDKIIEIGAVKVCDGKVAEKYSTLVNPNVEIPEKIVEITGISNEMVINKPYISDVLQDFFRFMGDTILIGHNLKFDFSFLMQAAYDNKVKDTRKWYGIDTLKLARMCLDKALSKRLEDLCRLYDIADENHHRALNDAVITGKLYQRLCEEFETEDKKFEPELYIYKPKKQRAPSKREIERVERIIKRMGITPAEDIYHMSQSQLSRYVDKLALNHNK